MPHLHLNCRAVIVVIYHCESHTQGTELYQYLYQTLDYAFSLGDLIVESGFCTVTLMPLESIQYSQGFKGQRVYLILLL